MRRCNAVGAEIESRNGKVETKDPLWDVGTRAVRRAVTDRGRLSPRPAEASAARP